MDSACRPPCLARRTPSLGIDHSAGRGRRRTASGRHVRLRCPRIRRPRVSVTGHRAPQRRQCRRRVSGAGPTGPHAGTFEPRESARRAARISRRAARVSQRAARISRRAARVSPASGANQPKGGASQPASGANQPKGGASQPGLRRESAGRTERVSRVAAVTSWPPCPRARRHADDRLPQRADSHRIWRGSAQHAYCAL
jgi:hypothetical protein